MSVSYVLRVRVTPTEHFAETLKWEEQCVSVVYRSALKHCTLHAADRAGGFSLRVKSQEGTLEMYSVWKKS